MVKKQIGKSQCTYVPGSGFQATSGSDLVRTGNGGVQSRDALLASGGRGCSADAASLLGLLAMQNVLQRLVSLRCATSLLTRMCGVCAAQACA